MRAFTLSRHVPGIVITFILASLLAACGSSGNNTTSTTSSPPASAPPTSGGSSGGTGSGGSSTGGGAGGSATGFTPRFVYAIDGFSGSSSQIAAFTINPNTGSLAAVAGSNAPVAVESGPMAATPQTAFVYSANELTNIITIFSANSSSGALSPLSSFTVTGLRLAAYMLVSPNGQTLYIADANGEQIFAYSIGGSGNLSAVSGSPYAVSQPVSSLTMDAAGKFLFASGDNAVFGYSVAANGGLTAVSGSPFTVRPVFVTPGKGLTGLFAQLDPQAHFLFVADETAPQAFVYSVGANGSLTAVAGSPFNDQVLAGAAAIGPVAGFFYVASFNTAQVAGFSINQTTGAINPVPGSPFDNGPSRNGGAPIQDLRVDPSGKFLLASDTDTGKITVFSIDASTGALTNVSGSPFVVGSGSGNPGSIQVTH